MRVPVELLEDADRDRAADLIEEWGYPRGLTDWELDEGHWFAWGLDVLFWFTPTQDEHQWALHICMEPRARGVTDPQETLSVLRVICQLLRGRRMWVFLNESMGQWVEDYLTRLGFAKENGGMVYELGDERWEISTSASS